MPEVEREYIKSVDDEILKASGKALKKLQQLDLKTQLHLDTFYEAYANYPESPRKENLSFKTQFSRKK